MFDPMVSLAFSMYSNKGGYALLLGSGISRAAGIPTGWEVVLDLLRQTAAIEGKDCEPEPDKWFAERTGQQPRYDDLLKRLAPTPAERAQLLRRYFEPSEAERAQGVKAPTRAHLAIAGLVARGFVRVVITTNFDRLLEHALEAAGISPTVVATADGAAGLPPLHQVGCLLVKVHGDYQDTRIRNTPEELARYSRPMTRLLDRIFDEYGLVICGWSGDWDVALCDAIERCPTRRFTTYWATRSALGEKGRQVADSRRATVVPIKDADTFFVELGEKLASCETLGARHPATVQLAVTTLKRLLQDGSRRIDLHDLVLAEARRSAETLMGAEFAAKGPSSAQDEIQQRLGRYWAHTETLMAMLVTSFYWDKTGDLGSWIKALDLVGTTTYAREGSLPLIQLRRYPLLVLLYAGGISAVLGQNYPALALLLLGTHVREDSHTVPAFEMYPHYVMDHREWQALPGLERHHTPGSDHLFSVLREVLRDCEPDDAKYQHAFDRFEYLLSMTQEDQRTQSDRMSWSFLGRFWWRYHANEESSVIAQVTRELERDEDQWPPLQAGMFGRSLDRAKHAHDAVLLRVARQYPM